MISHRWINLVASLIFALAVDVAWAAFQDPIDAPAAMTIKAAMQHMNGVAVAGDSLVAVGRRGVIIVSDDAGKTWTQSVVPVGVDLTAVSFPTAKKGWAVGHGGVVLSSSDGGKTWTKNLDGRKVVTLVSDYYEKRAQGGDAAAAKLLPDVKRLVEDGPIHPFLDVWFESEQVGYVVGAFNLILRTDDGGKTWTPWLDRMDNPKVLHFYGIRGAEGEVFVIGEQGMVLRLDKATQRFVPVPTPYEGSYFGLALRPGNLVVVGLRGNAFRSQDNGKTWRKLDTKLQMAMSGVTFFPDGRLVMVSVGGDLLLSNDGGETLTRHPVARKGIPMHGVTTVGANGVAIAGMFGVDVESVNVETVK